MRPAFLIALVLFFVCRVAFTGETITAQEVEGYFYADGEMKRSKGQFEITYYVEGDTVTRTRVYDLDKKQVIPAFQRLLEARDSVRPSGDASLLYIPLLETLTRADVIEERLDRSLGKKWVDKLPASIHPLRSVIDGFRYARNSAHDEWAIAVCLTDESEFLRDWCWRETLLVGRPQKKNLAAYENHLA